jgi:hypothetical protein
LIALISFSGCDRTSQSTDSQPIEHQASFKDRYEAAIEREQPLNATGVTSNMVQSIVNVTEEFFPEAAARIAEACKVPLVEAELMLRAQMKQAAVRCEEEYVQENGYGTIVLVLRAADARAVVVHVMESDPTVLREKYCTPTPEVR